MIIDAQWPLEINIDSSPRATNLIARAKTLSAGLNFLYGRVRVVEMNLLPKLEAESPGMKQSIFGNHPTLNDVRQDLVECAFHWYSASACNLVKVVQSVAEMAKPERDCYEKTILGPLKGFRDKIGAHIAGATGNIKDNAAEQQYSAFPAISWNDDRFFAGSYVLGVTRSGKNIDSSVIAPWSLTEFHESLSERFPMIAETLPEFTRQTE